MQLASVCLAVHRAEGGQSHSPPGPDNAIAVVLKGILDPPAGLAGGGKEGGAALVSE